MKVFKAVCHLASCLAMLSLLALNVAQAEAELGIFTTRFVIDIDSSTAFQRLTLSDAVYRASQHAYCRDLRIFDANGAPVPFAITPAATPMSIEVKRQTLSWFPLPAQTVDTADQWAAGVKITADGSLKWIAPPAPSPERSGDLIDVSGLEGVIDALHIQLAENQYQGRVRVLASDDLKVWQSVGEGSLLSLQTPTQQLRQQRIALSGIHKAYLQLQWLDRVPLIAAIEAEIEITGSNRSQAPQWQTLSLLQSDVAKGEYIFDNEGCFTAEGMDIMLPQTNTVVEGRLENSDYLPITQHSPLWHQVAATQLYRLQESGQPDLTQPILHFPPQNKPYWRLHVATDYGGIGTGNPVLKMAWRPATLTFLARGAAPFILAVGANNVAYQPMPLEALPLSATTAIGDARLGVETQHQVVSGVIKQPKPDGTRIYVLWAVLLAAVALLAMMAFHLFKGLKK